MNQPPKLADRLLEWFCDPYLLEDLQGDLYEVYEDKYQKSRKNADLIYWWLVIRSFRWSALKKNQKFKNSGLMMTKNNFKIAGRVLWRDKFNSSINLLGLTIGITCFILLGLYVKQEFSYDQFHKKKDRIYRTWLKEDYGDGKEFFNSITPLRFEALLEENFPEVERAIQYIEQNHLVGRGENRIDERVSVVSPDLFNVFDFKIIEGNEKSPLPTRNDIVISELYAGKYFGDRDPIGQKLALQIDENIRDFTVSAIMKDIPDESSIRFNLAISTGNNRELYSEGALSGWFTIVTETYVLLKEGATVDMIDEKMQDVVMSFLGEEVNRGEYNIGLQLLTDIHLNPNIPLGYAPVANPEYVYILGAIGLLVLIIACVNYTTLAMGQSLKRKKEVGMRKVLGAHKRTLIYQYLSESLLLSLIAMSIGSAIAILLIPTFNTLTGTSILYDFQAWHLLIFIAIGVTIGIISGIYPSFILSGFKTIKILQGNLSLGKLTARKSLVVFQFLITVFLISTTLIMKKQINFLQGKDLGYNYEAVISTRLPTDPAAQGLSKSITSGMNNGEILKAGLSKYLDIKNIAMATHIFGRNGWAQLGFEDKDGNFRKFRILTVDSYYLSAFNIKITEGRSFEVGNGLDDRQSIILNQTAVDYFNLEDPLGKKLPGDDFGDHQIIGVAKDFHYSSLHSVVEPLVIVQNPVPVFKGVSDADFSDSLDPKLVFTYTGSDLTEATKILKKEWEAVFPNENWNFNFIDEQIKLQYENEARMNRLISVATFLSIIIAILGLLGLSLLVVNSKVKEIGIRKVMGASALSIFRLLAKGFYLQIVISIALSVPITLLLINKWLENFAYRTEIGIELFIISGVISILLAMMVISYHTIRASKVNPVESLRTD
ncbi:ABC transporter permease [Ekhidna sp.]